MEKISLSKTVAIGFPILLLLYFFYLIIFNIPQTYIIDIGAESDMDSGKDAYLSDLTAQGRLSARMFIEDDTFRNMTGSPVYFNFTAKDGIFNDTKITAELKFRGDSDLDIGVHKAYAWKPLYMKSLDNYTLAKRFDEAAIYALDDRSIYTDYDNMSEWISANIPKYSTIKLYDFSPGILVNRDITYKDAEIRVNQTFRGTHSFLVYLKDSLNLTLGKQDLNSYNGRDVYSVELYDPDGNLVFKDTMPDDGIINNSSRKMPPLFKSFFKSGIREGSYELRFVNVKGENQADDSTITGIRINTDKIVTQGTILPLNPGTLFFELKRNTTLKFYAWHGDAVQNITIRGTIKKDVIITKSLLSKWISVELPQGNYSLSIKGNLYLSGANFAFKSGSIFQPYNYELNNVNSDWVMISNYQVKKDKEGWITAKKVFRGSELKLLDNKTIVFGLMKKGNNDVMLDEFKVSLTP